MSRQCLTMPHHEHLAKTDPTYRAARRQIESATTTLRVAARTTPLRIPVVVHVIHDASFTVDMPQIASQIAVLNRDFRRQNQDALGIPDCFREYAGDAMIEFALATRDPDGNATTGVTYTSTTQQTFPGDTAILDARIKRELAPAWPAKDYLNLWVCSLGGLLGYAQFPGGPEETDGVVIGKDCFGTSGTAKAPFHLGRTATHEVGHWLNLLHIWGDDGQGCQASDNVEDTPNQAGSNAGMPQYPRLSCNNGPHGDMFMNFMDYSDDAAMSMFTLGQCVRMDLCLRTARSTLADTKGFASVAKVATDPTLRRDGTLRLGLRVIDVSGDRTERIFDGVEWVPRS